MDTNPLEALPLEAVNELRLLVLLPTSAFFVVLSMTS